ncbi:MAG: hypothetical protein KGO94_10265, partial [Alphaproteobacteria bacterium]|nr:hypothetical protein [Alphaproteobacteria bacterium]
FFRGACDLVFNITQRLFHMKKNVFLALNFLLLSSSLGFAGETVTLTAKISQPSLTDKNQPDSFAVGLADKQIETSLKISCKAASAGLITRQDSSCAVTGTGVLINPNNGQKIPRTQYAGGWIEKQNGFADGATMSTNYLAVGKVPASTGVFAGSLMLKPEKISTGASLLRDSIMKNFASTQTGLIDQRVDTVQFNNFTIPSGGMPSDKGCIWNGDMVYAYQTESWFMNVTAKCGSQTIALKGNMPFTATPNVGSQHQYDLTLTMPPAEASTDEGLFAKPTGDGDLFAAADGISGQIIMKESNYVDTEVDGKIDKVATEINATGTLTGQNVPLEAVRSFSTIIAILSRTFFGA